MRLKDIALSTKDTFYLEPAIIEIVPGFNARTDFGDLESLGANIAENGLKQPLRVRQNDGRIELVDGERRLRAILLKIEQGHSFDAGVPCISEPKNYSEQQRTLDLLLFNDGKPLTMIEEARVIARLQSSYGLAELDIAKKTSRSITHIKNCLALLGTPESVQMAVESGKIAATLVIDLMKTVDTPEQLDDLVQTTIHNATSAGKKHATKKHVPAPAPSVEPVPSSASVDESSAPLAPCGPSTDTPETPSQSDSAPTETTTNTPAPIGHRVDWNSVPSLDDRKGSSDPKPGKGAGIDRNLDKLSKAMEAIAPEKCTIPDRIQTIEFVIDFLEGNRTVKDLKNHLGFQK